MRGIVAKARIFETKASFAPNSQFSPTSFGNTIVFSPQGMALNRTDTRMTLALKKGFIAKYTASGIAISLSRQIKYTLASEISFFEANSEIVIPASSMLTGPIHDDAFPINVVRTFGNSKLASPMITPIKIEIIGGFKSFLNEKDLPVRTQYPTL